MAILGELNLHPNYVSEILDKAIEMSDNISFNDLPSFCYYVLLDSRHCSDSTEIFTHILLSMTHFEEENRDKSKIKPVLGTILMHLTLAVRQDANLMKQVLKLARTPPLRLLHSIFFASFLLALSASPPYSDSIYPCLRNHLVRHLKFNDRASHALWIDKLADSVGGVLPITSVLLLAAKQGYADSVVESSVNFAFYMLDALTSGLSVSAVASRACQHANSLIILAFQSSEIAQEPILSLLFERLLSNGSSTSRGYYLLDVVKQLVVKGPHFLMKHSAKLRQLIDFLPSLPVETAESIIKTLMILFRVNLSLRDCLLLLLRKLLFSRRIEHRQLAAKGYIQFLLNFKVVGGMANTQPSQSSFTASQVNVVGEVGRSVGDKIANPNSRTGNDALCLEILGILKRCLEQQADVRRIVYKSLPEVLHKNSQLVDPVLQLLAIHLRDFSVDFSGNTTDSYVNDDASSSQLSRDGDLPILFSKCVKKSEIVEPIVCLCYFFVFFH